MCRRIFKGDAPYSRNHLPIRPDYYALKFLIFVCLGEDYTYLSCPAKMALRNRLGRCIVHGFLKSSPSAVIQLSEGFNGILFLNPTLLLSRPFINLGYHAYVCLHS